MTAPDETSIVNLRRHKEIRDISALFPGISLERAEELLEMSQTNEVISKLIATRLMGADPIQILCMGILHLAKVNDEMDRLMMKWLSASPVPAKDAKP